MTDTDGNIGVERTSVPERISGLLFDISKQNKFWESGAAAKAADKLKDTVVEINQLSDLEALGITPYAAATGETAVENFLNGIPYYHIRHYLMRNGGYGRLYVAFADCSANWDALNVMQRASGGMISQFGVWTEQALWRETDGEADTYGLEMVDDLELAAKAMADQNHAPAVIVLNANPNEVSGSTEGGAIVFSKLPNCYKKDARYVTVALGQAVDNEVRAMQVGLASKTPVGNIGAVIGELSITNVGESIGYVARHNISTLFPDIELGFGDATIANGALTNSMRYDALTMAQIDALDDKGYLFLCKYAGVENGIYFNGDPTCSEGDYRTIFRNRVINKSRRLVRSVLLPYVNAPIRIDPTNGQLSAAQIAVFSNSMRSALDTMVTASEVSGIGHVTVPANQNILKNDKLIASYSLIPMGTSKTILVTEHLALSQEQ